MKGRGDFSIGSDVWPGTSKVLEEMGELQQVLGKLMGAHGKTDHWDGSDLEKRLVEEVGDLLAALDFFMAHNMESSDARVVVAARRVAKLSLFELWHAGQDQQLLKR